MGQQLGLRVEWSSVEDNVISCKQQGKQMFGGILDFSCFVDRDAGTPDQHSQCGITISAEMGA